MTAASRSLATALWRARFASGLLRPSYTTNWDTTQEPRNTLVPITLRARPLSDHGEIVACHEKCALGLPETALDCDSVRHVAMIGAKWCLQSFVLGPACRAGAHVCVGIAEPHIRSRALSATEGASSPAKYRALSASASIHQVLSRHKRPSLYACKSLIWAQTTEIAYE